MKRNCEKGFPNGRFGKALIVLFVLMVLTGTTQAIAANMIETAAQNSKTVEAGKLVTKGDDLRYRFKKSKEYAKKIWLKIGSAYYYFDKNGNAKTGWFTYKGNEYYANADGRIYHSRWKTYKGKKYYLQEDGIKAKNKFVTIDGKIYRFTTKGVLVTYRMYEIKDNWYYSRKDGSLLTNGWLRTASGKRYYFDQNGMRLKKQWIFDKGKFYYLSAGGAMAVNKTIGKYKVGKDGARIINHKSYVFVGDSRVVGMDYAISDSDVSFIGKVSMGYSWMVSTAIPSLEKKLEKDPTLYVVFCFGINDLGNVNSYIGAYQRLISKYKYANFFFLSVNPVDYAKARAHGYRVTNQQIEAFNARLKEAMDFRYLNTYAWLKKKGFGSNDGIHYTADSYRKLYQYVLKKTG